MSKPKTIFGSFRTVTVPTREKNSKIFQSKIPQSEKLSIEPLMKDVKVVVTEKRESETCDILKQSFMGVLWTPTHGLQWMLFKSNSTLPEKSFQPRPG